MILLLPRVLFYFYQEHSFIAPKSEEHDFLHFLTKSALSGRVLFQRALPKTRALFEILRRARSQNESALRVLFSLDTEACFKTLCLK